MAHWIVVAIIWAYQAQDVLCLLGVMAYSTRGIAAMLTLANGASLADICRAVGWTTPNTFTRFYSRCMKTVLSLVLVLVKKR